MAKKSDKERKAEHLLGILTETWKDNDRAHGWTVVDYVREEVTRQRHDVTQPEGIQRVAWMLDAWCYACRLDGDRPTVEDTIKLGQIIEPDKNRLGLRTVGVGVRDSISGLMVKKFPDFDQVPRLLEILFEQRDQLEPIEFYRQFELVHPFIDGNGRAGKVLLNWLSGTLLHPFFPPADLFGTPIMNP